ncbi:hypothetical protein ACTFIW_000015 [Dictyostelium discoideum]
MPIIRTQKSSTAELLIKSWEPSTLKVYSSCYTRFRNFCTLNSLNPANITLVVFMDNLTHLFKHKHTLAFSTINGHRSMLNQLLLQQSLSIQLLRSFFKISSQKKVFQEVLEGKIFEK